MKKRLYLSSIVICICCIFIIMFSLSPPLTAADTPEKKVIETPELDSLSNDELLKQTMNILNETSARTFARLRALAKSEILLSQARQNTKLPLIPEKELVIKSSENADPVEIAKIQSEHAKKRVDALKQKLELIQTEKALADEYIRQTDNALSAVQSLINTIEGLSLHLLEIRLRIEDKTLAHDKIPEALNERKLNTLTRELTIQQKGLRNKAETGHKSLETIISGMEEAKKTVIEAEVGLSSSEEKYSRELKRQTMEKEYSAQTREQMMVKLSEEEDELILLNGAFNLSHSIFISSKEKAEQIQKETKMHSKPEVEEYLESHAYIRAEEAEKAINKVNEVAEYYDIHIKILEELDSALKSLVKRSDTFQGDATVLLEHIFKMQVMVKKLENKGKTDAVKISKNLSSQSLTDASDSASKLMTEAVTAVQKAKEELTHIPGMKEEAAKKQKDMKEFLIRLKGTQDSAKQARQWASEIEKLTPEQLIAKFQKNNEKIMKNKTELDAIRTQVGKCQTAVDEIQKKLDALKDPLLRIAQQESLEEKYNIQKLLHQIANLEFNSGKNDIKDKTKPVLSVNQEKAPEASLSKNWQTLLFSRLGIIAEKKKLRSELLVALNNLNQENKKYTSVLSETGKLTMQHHKTAMELKKRLGHRQINMDIIPDGITEALKKTLISQIEKETAELTNKQILLGQQIETLSISDEILEKTQALLTQALTSIGKRLDIIDELKKMEQLFNRKQDELSETELKKMQHATIRRMEVENTIKEFFLSVFVHSKSAENLSELLQVYYRDIIEQEFRQTNIEKRKEITERLTGLAQVEKTAVSKLLPLLEKTALESEIQKQEEWIKIRVRLTPDKAREIIADFKSRTGRNLSVPPPVPEDQKVETVQKAAVPLFERHIEQAASEKWIEIFKQRISASGIDSEIGKYRDQKGTLNAASQGIQRRMYQLTGHPRSELEKLTPEEKPKNGDDMQRFLKGEIGVLRADRYKIWIQKGIEVIVKLFSILASAIFLHWLTNFLTGRFTLRSKKSDSEKDSGAVVILPLLKTFSKFLIWIVAIMAILSSLGFNVGAILAGFGIGGLAIAMAAKETLSDVMGGISILLSQSFKSGDVILFNKENHKVENIGLRYTRLRPNSTKFLVTVPNSQLAQSEAINVMAAPDLFINIDIPLSTRNSKNQIELALNLLTDIINETPDLKLKIAKFSKFGDYSFILSLRYIIQNYPARHKLQTELNKEIVRRFNENKIEFAVLPHADCLIPGSENITKIFKDESRT
ncbi:mechanosensitive ion channel [Desulfobacterales bacterium HSG17]|nr:mechanosensitive ion channel [Desulfobacterales bacterium HSG17]